MKDLPSGVYEESGNLGIDFRYKGERYHELLRPNGISLPDTSPNRKYAENYREKIRAAIRGEKMGGAPFNIEEWLPGSKRIQRRQRSGHTGDINGVITSWLNKISVNLANSTLIDYKRFADEFTELWGRLAPPDLTITMLDEWITESQRNGRSRKRIKNMMCFLRGALDQAETKRLIKFNPANLIKWKKIKATEVEKIKHKQYKNSYPFDLGEIARLLDAAVGIVRELLIFGFGLGCRLNEIFGLAWEDIDLTNGVIHFTYGRVKRHMTTLKTDESDRYIDLREFPHVWAALRRLKSLTYLYPAMDLGQYGKRHFVFYNPLTNKPFGDSDEFLDRIWIPLLRKAGVLYRGPKKMRHTFATHYRLIGTPDLWTAKIFGHTTTAMVTNHYGRTLPPNAHKMAKTPAELQQFWANVA